MSYLMFELNVSEERKREYQELLRLNALGVHKSAEHLLRALQLMSPHDGLHCHGVVFTLARHVAEEVDAVSILMEKGSIEPCKLHLRSAFEADLGIRYILEADSERRAIAYHVKEVHERLRTNDKSDARTPSGKRILDAMKDDPVGGDVLASLPPYDFDAENNMLRALLARPPYDAVNAEWEARGRNPAWHSLFGGPKTVRDLAYHLQRPFWYEFLYSDWSGRAHAGRALRNVGMNSREPDRKGHAIRPIRHPEGLRDPYNFGMGLAVGIAHLLGQRYLTQIGQDELRRFYIEEIRPLTERVKKVKIVAEWY